MSGLIADSRTMIDRARVEAQVDMFKHFYILALCCFILRSVTQVPVKYLPNSATLFSVFYDSLA